MENTGGKGQRDSVVEETGLFAASASESIYPEEKWQDQAARYNRVYSPGLEEEASWLGPVLLVPNEAARWAVANSMSVANAAGQFQVSEDLMEFRLRMSGARQIGNRMRRRADI